MQDGRPCSPPHGRRRGARRLVVAIGCAVEAASIELTGAPSRAWLWIGTTDIYEVGRLGLHCKRGVVSSTFRLARLTATAYLTVESTASRAQRTLQPGQTLRLPSVSASERFSNQAVAWSVSPGGEAGWTDAHFVEVARPHCRADVRVLVTAFRNG